MSLEQATVESSTTNEPVTEAPQAEEKVIGVGTYGVVDLDPRNGRRAALKKIGKVFFSRKTALMALREVRMLCTFRHENVLPASDVLLPSCPDRYQEVYILTDLLHTDLRQLIHSERPLSADKIKMLLYQMMRGLKYIHSSKVIHRDIKPGNLLVNDELMLKICDFGMARAEVRDRSERMSLNVVTQSYRGPEIFLGTKHYTGALDIWAAACVFAELLGREVLFNSRNQLKQLNQMIYLLGTPLMSDIDYASDNMKKLVGKLPWKPSKICSLHDLGPYATANAVDLLSRMLKFDPTKRISAAEALDYPYLDRGRYIYLSVLYECCGMTSSGEDMEAMDFEPVASEIYDARWEENITSLSVARKKMYRYIEKRQSPDRNQQLWINPKSCRFGGITKF